MQKHNLISVCLTLFFLSVLFFLFHRSEIVFQSTRHDFYIKYYIITSIFLLFSILTFFIEKNLKIKILLILLSILIGLYIIEIYLTISARSKFDFNNYDVLEEYKKRYLSEPNIKIAMLPNQLSENLHSLGGISNSETIYCNEHGYFTQFKSDRYGFNNDDKVWNSNDYEYVLVGDSFLMGSCVPENQTISGNLRKNSNNKKIINLGYSGNDPILEYATLKEYLPKNVKNIIWIYYEGNDLFELKRRLTNSFLKKYLNDFNYSQKLKQKQDLINFYLEKKFQKIVNIDKKHIHEDNKLIKIFKFYSLRTIFIEPIFSKPNFDEFEKIIIYTKKLAKSNNSKLYFVYLPTYESISNYNFSRHKNNYRQILKTIKRNNIEIIDLMVEFKKFGDPLKLFPFKDDGHLDKIGYKIISDAIMKITN